jgi:hypothetical protein
MGTRAEELFYDSEATLRLVDTVLDELQVMEEEVTRSEDRVRFLTEQAGRAHAGIADLPEILSRAYVEIQSVLESLRRSRSVLERSTVDKCQHMNEKLREVSSATELAANDILDGVDRALALVDRLDTTEGESPAARADGFAELRNELFGVMGCLQFQDITSQQLGYAASVLSDIEGRLAELARIFDPAAFGRAAAPVPLVLPEHAAFDPAATTLGAEHRQAVVDEIFGTPR